MYLYLTIILALSIIINIYPTFERPSSLVFLFVSRYPRNVSARVRQVSGGIDRYSREVDGTVPRY